MKKTLIVVLLVAVTAGILFAGAINTSTTVVDIYPDGSGYASGVLSHTQQSSDDVQTILCQVTSSEGNDNQRIICIARDAEMDYLSGFSYDAKYAKLLATINEDSYIEFKTDSSGDIIRMTVTNGSPFVR